MSSTSRTRLASAALLVLVTACGADDAVSVGDGSVDAGLDSRLDVVDAAFDAPSIEAAPPLRASCRKKGTVSGVWLPSSHYCLELYATGLSQARQMAFAPNGDLLVKAGISVFVLSDADKDGVISPTEMTQFAAPSGGTTHGVALGGGFVYASSDTTIYRFPYANGDKVTKGPEEIVVKGIPGAGHFTRTLAFDAQGRLYVNVGSAGNVDEAPLELALRGMIRRFTLPKTIPKGGLDYTNGEVWASGMRNEVGFSFDSLGRAWGVENGRDSLYDTELGLIGNENPAEEINRLDGPGARFFGYPYCWTESSIDGGLGAGTQWADDTITPSLRKTDDWCRDTTQVHPPAYALQGHAAPLGVVRYEGDSLPLDGDLVVAEHGSYLRTPPVGRILVRAKLAGDAVVGVEPLVGEADGAGKLKEGTWDARPVDVRVGPDGAVYFSDDLGERVFRLGYDP